MPKIKNSITGSENYSSEELFGKLEHLCISAGIDFSAFLTEMESALKVRIKNLLTPNEEWFKNGKSLQRYWNFVEEVTGKKWDHSDVFFWFNLLRNPSETREQIPPSLRYAVLERDKSTCQKCGRKAPDVQVEVDHILAWNLGGPTVIDNLQTLCMDCNIGKSNKYFNGGK